MRIHLVSGNQKKINEIRAIVGEDIIRNVKLDLPELQGASPEEISKEKCKLAWEQRSIGGPDGEEITALITDDTNLCFHALKDLPGPYIKWFLAKMGSRDLPKLLHAFEDKSAAAMCCIAYMDTTLAEPICFTGLTEGKIVQPPGEENQFATWDPTFMPEGFDRTFAQMTMEEKNTISHRKKACEALRQYVEKRLQADGVCGEKKGVSPAKVQKTETEA